MNGIAETTFEKIRQSQEARKSGAEVNKKTAQWVDKAFLGN